MLVLVKRKKDSANGIVVMDYFHFNGSFGSISIDIPLLCRPMADSLPGIETNTPMFGSRFSAEAVELGMYQSVSVEKKSGQISGIIPSFRYIGIAPEAIKKFDVAQNNVVTWGNPLWTCGFDNLFVYNHTGYVVRQYSVMTSKPPAGVSYQPWVYSAYDREMSTWEHLLHVNEPNEIVWMHHLENPTKNPALALNDCTSGKRATWTTSAASSKFTYGQYVDERLEGQGAHITHSTRATLYYLGEFKNNLRDGKGCLLSLSNGPNGGAVLLHGTWTKDKLNGAFVAEYTGNVSEQNMTERGTYHMNVRVGLWFRQFKSGEVNWFQDNCLMTTQNEDNQLKYLVFGDENNSKFISADAFLSLLIGNQYHELLAKMIESHTPQELFKICANAVQKGEHRAPVVCFSNRIESCTPNAISLPLLVDNARLLAIFKLALPMLASEPSSPLYIAVKSAIDLYSSNLDQNKIVTHVTKVFPDVTYTKVHNKNAKQAIEQYQQNIRQHYVIGILERIGVIASLLAETSRPAIQSLNQLLGEVQRENEQLIEQQKVEEQHVEAESVHRQEKARWAKVCIGLDEDVLAFMRELRADEKSARIVLVDRYQHATKVLLASARKNASVSLTKNVQTPPVSSVKNTATVSAPSEQSRMNSVKQEKKSEVISKPSLSLGNSGASNKKKPFVVQQKHKQPFLGCTEASMPRSSVAASVNVVTVSASERQSVKKQVTQSDAALCRDTNVNQVDIPFVSVPARPSVNHCVIALPSFVVHALKGYSESLVNDYYLIYKGMMIKALKASHQSILPDEEACLRVSQVKEKHYFWGFRNAFLGDTVLYTALLNAAQFHAKAMIYLTEGKTFNLDDVEAFFQNSSTAQCFIKKIMSIKCTSNPEQYLITDESALHKIVFGLLIEMSDEMGLGALVDRRYFTGDYREYLANIRSIISMKTQASHTSVTSNLEKTAMSCFKSIIMSVGHMDLPLNRPFNHCGK